MESEMLAIERNLEAQSTALCGEVTISATEGTGTEWLTPVLRDFHREYLEILLNVQIESRSVDLIHREADIALRSLEDLPLHKLVGLLGPGNRARETHANPVTRPLPGNYACTRNCATAHAYAPRSTLSPHAC